MIIECEDVVDVSVRAAFQYVFSGGALDQDSSPAIRPTVLDHAEQERGVERARLQRKRHGVDRECERRCQPGLRVLKSQSRSTFGRVEERQEIGGSQDLEFTNEVIFPILQGLGVKGVIFFDAGQAFTAEDGIQLTKLRYAFGGGLRWLSPFGPLRVELGIPINPREGDDKSVVLFSFGGPLQ